MFNYFTQTVALSTEQCSKPHTVQAT